MRIGHKIKEIRERKNISQKQLEILTSISQQQLSQYESGEDIKMSKLLKIAEALDTPVEDFLNDHMELIQINKDNNDQTTNNQIKLNINISVNDKEEIESLKDFIQKIIEKR